VNLNVEFSGRVAVVELSVAALDGSNSGNFRASLVTAVGEVRQVALGLASVRAIDSAGMGALISVLRALRALGGDLKLFGVTEPVLATLSLVRLDRVFAPLPTRAAALEAFAGDASAALR
jgi:anti-sigma B factor antagonist